MTGGNSVSYIAFDKDQKTGAMSAGPKSIQAAGT